MSASAARNQILKSQNQKKSPLGTTMRNCVPVFGGGLDRGCEKSVESLSNQIVSRDHLDCFLSKWELQEIARKISCDYDLMPYEEKLRYNYSKNHSGEISTDQQIKNWKSIIADHGGNPEKFKWSLPRIVHCLRTPIKSDVSILKPLDPNKKMPFYNGVQSCGSVWNCPICAPKITEHRRREIVEAVEKWAGMDDNNGCIMVTFTFPHNRGQDLRELRKVFMKSRRLMKKQKVLKRDPDFWTHSMICEKYGVKGTITAAEITYSDDNGWHLHSHDLYFLRKVSDAELENIRIRFTLAWMRACKRVKMVIPDAEAMLLHSVKISQANSPADYIAKFGMTEYLEHKDVLNGGWGVSEELTKAHLKKGKKKGLTPWDFLRCIAESPEDKSVYIKYGVLFKEYMGAMKGAQQIFFEKGFREFLGLDEIKKDQQIVDEAQDVPSELIGVLNKIEWSIVVKNKLRGQVLVLASKLKFAELRAMLRQVGTPKPVYSVGGG